MADFEVHLSPDGRHRRIGLARSNRARGRETVLFEYDVEWLRAPDRFALAPALPLTRGSFAPPAGHAIHGPIGDSAPDTWGRRLMQRAERRQAEREGRAVRTLMESDYLLGVADQTRLGALRFRPVGGEEFLARSHSGAPPLVELGRLLSITERILRDEETDDDLQLIFAPGSSLGGARPKASVVDQHGRLAIAKFPKIGGGVFRALVGQGPRHHQGSRGRDRDLAGCRAGSWRPPPGNPSHGQRLRAR